MSILNVNTIQPVGSGQTITVSATNITASSAALTVGSITNTSGSTVVAAGSASAPSISPTGDSNTGIFFPSADTVAIAEGGAEALRVDSSGRVGVGTNNPSQTLHTVGTSLFNVSSSTSDGPFYIAGNKATTQGAIAHIRNDNVSGSDDVFGGLKISSSPGGDFIIGKNSRLGSGYLQVRRETGTQLLTLDESGNVGINSTIPAAKLDILGGSSQQLQITGTEADIWLKSTGPGTIWRILGSTGGGTHRFRIYDQTNSLERFGIDSSGRVQMPYQPYARASSTSLVSSGNAIPLNSYNLSRGGITISGNRFTVPVAGAYVFGYHHLGNSGSGACQVEIRHNGTYVSGTRTQDTNSSNDSFGTQTVKELAASDYIEFWVIQGATHNNTDYNSMWIWLIG